MSDDLIRRMCEACDRNAMPSTMMKDLIAEAIGEIEMLRNDLKRSLLVARFYMLEQVLPKVEKEDEDISGAIVTVLRHWAENAKEQGTDDVVAVLTQAADEIERLRAERDALVEQRDRWIAGTQLHAARANENPPEIRSHRDSADA